MVKEGKRIYKKTIGRNKKILGICLGVQLLAECLGGKVFKNKYKEIGWFSVMLTPATKNSRIFKDIPDKFLTFHWYDDTFTLPYGAKHIAYSNACKNQAFVYGNNIVGLQFHPEVKIKSLITFSKKFYKGLKKEKYVQEKQNLIPDKDVINQNHRIIKTIINAFSCA